MSDSPESHCMRTFEYLMNKYRDDVPLDLKRTGNHPDQREHDEIIDLYYKKKLTIAAISQRCHRSLPLVIKIINRKHKLYKNETR